MTDDMESVILFSSLVPIDCGHPGMLDHGTVLGNSTQYGDTVTFSCDPGYQLSDDSLSSSTCQQDGQWTHPIPTCVRLTMQPSPTPSGSFLSPPSTDNLLYLRIGVVSTIIVVLLFLVFAVAFLCVLYHKALSKKMASSKGHSRLTARGNGD